MIGDGLLPSNGDQKSPLEDREEGREEDDDGQDDEQKGNRGGDHADPADRQRLFRQRGVSRVEEIRFDMQHYLSFTRTIS